MKVIKTRSEEIIRAVILSEFEWNRLYCFLSEAKASYTLKGLRALASVVDELLESIEQGKDWQ